MNTKELNFAYKVRHALNEHIDVLPASTTKQLASARKLALSRKKADKPARIRVVQTVLAGGVHSLFSGPVSLLGRLSVAAPLVIGALVFVGMFQYEQQQRITETAELDAAVLSDDLPLSAYIDRGFNAYLAKQGE